MSERLDFTLHLARMGGQVLRERFLQPREIHPKGWRDFYTDADLTAQHTIVDLIRTHDPHSAVLAEEGLEPSAEAPAVWVIDPLDGTVNYARHFPVFAVSIGYVERGQPQLGVVYDPLHERIFYAERQGGAWLNTDRIQAAATADIASAMVGLDWGRGEAQRGTCSRAGRPPRYANPGTNPIACTR